MRNDWSRDIFKIGKIKVYSLPLFQDMIVYVHVTRATWDLRVPGFLQNVSHNFATCEKF